MADQSNHRYFFNKTRGKMLASEAGVALSLVARLVGLLKTEVLAPGKGLFIAPCSQIHMFGMKYAIDAVFMNKAGKVVGLCRKIEPGKISPLFGRAYACLELPAGVIEESGTDLGDEIESGKAANMPTT